MPRKSPMHRAQTMLCARFMNHLNQQIGKANERERANALSTLHRTRHRDTLADARTLRADGATHARLMQMAKTHRFYFSQMRQLGA